MSVVVLELGRLHCCIVTVIYSHQLFHHSYNMIKQLYYIDLVVVEEGISYIYVWYFVLLKGS